MTTIGVFGTHAQAQQAVDELRAGGVDAADISYLYMNASGDVQDGNSSDKVGSGAATGATTGAVIGAIAGLVVANGILPGLGSLFAAGPLAAALGFTGAAATTVAGAATGLAAGGLIGALVNLGISDEDAAAYENFIRTGRVIVIAHSAVSMQNIFSRAGATEIGVYT